MDDLIKKIHDTFKHFIHESIRHVWDDTFPVKADQSEARLNTPTT
jgi:hypothetical protein